MVGQPRSLHGRAPRFQMPSAMVKLPAAPPLRDCEKAICICELAQIDSLAVTTAAVGDGAGAVVGVACGDAVGVTIGSGDGAKGLGVPGGFVVGTPGFAVHDAT